MDARSTILKASCRRHLVSGMCTKGTTICTMHGFTPSSNGNLCMQLQAKRNGTTFHHSVSPVIAHRQGTALHHSVVQEAIDHRAPLPLRTAAEILLLFVSAEGECSYRQYHSTTTPRHNASIHVFDGYSKISTVS